MRAIFRFVVTGRNGNREVLMRAAFVVLAAGLAVTGVGAQDAPLPVDYCAMAEASPGMRALSDALSLGRGRFEGTFVGRFEVADVAERPHGPPNLFGKGKLPLRFVLMDVLDTEFFLVPKR